MVILSDGSGLLFTAAEKASEQLSKQIWYLSYPDGQARKITNDLNHYTDLSLNADSSTLVTVQEDINASIWVALNGDAAQAVQLPSVAGKMDGWDGIAWTPDGKIVYYSTTGGNEGIWIMDADGKNRKRLTSAETVAFWPSVTRDGRYIFYSVEVERIRTIWRMDIDGSNQKKFSAGSSPKTAAGFLYYGDKGSTWTVPIDGGEPVQTPVMRSIDRCAISSDGKLFACQFDPPDGSQARLQVISLEDGATVKDFTAKMDLPARIRWSPDGRSITYVSLVDGLQDIWSQPLEGGESKRSTNFKTDQIFSFAWSPDNKLVISHGTSASDVVLIRNTKP
jgi:Tol biopolymer transport system component